MCNKQSTSHEAAMSASHKYVEAFRKAYPQKTVCVYPVRNAGGEYEFKVTINGEGGGRRLILGELKDFTAAFLRLAHAPRIFGR